ncbi:hypothetical protein DFP73DRAFT_37809 [Morchella snyderi]|nr:hypothetical protein DFP73DRAFT_37809 [Morchella snyderi]
MSTTMSVTVTVTANKYSNDQVRVLGIDEYKSAARTLADAFFKDDVAFYCLETPDNGGMTREELYPLHLEILEYIVAAHCYNGLVLGIGEHNEGIALWMPPGKNMDDWFTIFRSGMWRLYWKLTKEGKKRYFEEFLEVLHQKKVETMGDQDKDAWYLVYLGVTPDARGRGYARKLIEFVTRKCDVDRAPCYLESSHVNNVPMYQRFGFVKKDFVTLGPNCDKPVHLDIMIREVPPKSSTTASTGGRRLAD